MTYSQTQSIQHFRACGTPRHDVCMSCTHCFPFIRLDSFQVLVDYTWFCFIHSVLWSRWTCSWCTNMSLCLAVGVYMYVCTSDCYVCLLYDVCMHARVCMYVMYVCICLCVSCCKMTRIDKTLLTVKTRIVYAVLTKSCLFLEG